VRDRLYSSVHEAADEYRSQETTSAVWPKRPNGGKVTKPSGCPMLPQKQSPTLTFLTYTDFVRLAVQLSDRIRQEGTQWDALLSINRGGAVLTKMLSDLLGNLPMLAFAAKSYQGIGDAGDIVLTQPLSCNLASKKVLLIDEICDTGKTFHWAIKYLETFQVAKIATACLITKPGSVHTPDFVMDRTADWVVFPYDVRETIHDLAVFWNQDHALERQLSSHFAQLGVPVEWLARIFEEHRAAQHTHKTTRKV
jgi:hypoxanthine phosphoribosyltransferase